MSLALPPFSSVIPVLMLFSRMVGESYSPIHMLDNLLESFLRIYLRLLMSSVCKRSMVILKKLNPVFPSGFRAGKFLLRLPTVLMVRTILGLEVWLLRFAQRLLLGLYPSLLIFLLRVAAIVSPSTLLEPKMVPKMAAVGGARRAPPQASEKCLFQAKMGPKMEPRAPPKDPKVEPKMVVEFALLIYTITIF